RKRSRPGAGVRDIGGAFEMEMKPQRVAVVVVLIDDEDAGPSSHRSIVGHRAVPINVKWHSSTGGACPLGVLPPSVLHRRRKPRSGRRSDATAETAGWI